MSDDANKLQPFISALHCIRCSKPRACYEVKGPNVSIGPYCSKCADVIFANVIAEGLKL